MNSPNPPPQKPRWLSQTEREMLELLVALHSNKQIADALNLSISTVKWHFTTLMRDLCVRDRLELLAWSLQHEDDVRVGHTRNRGLHLAGCRCSAGFCTAKRRIFDPPEDGLPKAA